MKYVGNIENYLQRIIPLSLILK